MSNSPVKTPALLRWLSLLIVVAALLVRFWPHSAFAPRAVVPAGAPAPAPAQQPPPAQSSAGRSPAFGPTVGFRSPERLAEHFHKHGSEFHAGTPGEYLRLAQALRDRPVGGDVLELVRADGVVTRFDRVSGGFIAFGADGVIRTFFRPNDGARYFERQAARTRGAVNGPDAVRAFLTERGLADVVVADGVEGLVSRWEQAGREAERERYPFGVEDWLNELDGRQLLQDLQAAVPGSVAGSLAARLEEADQRVRAATEIAGHCLWGDALARRMGWRASREWWYWRSPHAVGEDYEGGA